MKKILKGFMAVSIGLLLTGCNNNDTPPDTPVIEQENSNTSVEDINTDKIAMYQQAVQSVVRIEAGSQIGTGVVFKKEGGYAYILTNAHVLTDTNGAKYYEDIEIIFHDFSKVKGTYINMDRSRDIAVISVPDNISCVVAKIVAVDTNVKIGTSVFAIGNPGGEYFGVTDGIISANRVKTTTEYISGTDETKTYVYNSTATINGGNSGGPLFNYNGEVVSINTMRPSDKEIRNFNYSIPINYFIKVANHLMKSQTPYKNATLNGVLTSICDFPVDQLSDLGITVKNGVYVTSSSYTSLNRRIITHVNNNPIATVFDLEFELLKYTTGDNVVIKTTDITGKSVQTKDISLG